MDERNMQIEQVPQNDIPNGLLKIAIDEYGMMPLVCVGLCVLMGATVGGLVGVKLYIK